MVLFWGLAVPLLPCVFLLIPGLWRNLCPLAASNQLPRTFGFTHGLALTPALRDLSFQFGMLLLFCLVLARKWLFNDSAMATALLILGALCAAFLGGLPSVRKAPSFRAGMNSTTA